MAQSSIHLRMVIPPDPWTRAIEDGSVTIPGVTWDVNSSIDNAPDRFVASAGGADVGENGVRRLAIDLLRGAPTKAIPVFFGRELMQRNFIVREESDLRHLKDLNGRRIGSRLTIQSGTGAAVLMVLEKSFGVDLRSIEWHMGDPASLPANRMGLKLNPGPETDDENYARLMKGEVDAVMQTTGPRYHSMFGDDHVDRDLKLHPGTRPLVSDPEEMAAAYRQSRLYPISDLTTVSPTVVEQHPGLAKQLVDAFSQANARSSSHRSDRENAWAKREIELLGEDPHIYGLNENARANITAFVDFLHRMGAIERALPVDDLFYPSSL